MPVRLVSQERLPGSLKDYTLIERLGRGGFGEVWKVEAPGGLLKAAKFVFGDLEAMDEDSRPAEQELKALDRVKSIRHPYILSLERYEPVDGQLIIIMELADRNLWDRFRECKSQGLPGIPREELLLYMAETAEALDLMNNHYKIQHLDIKPQNLFLVFNHVKVADFGLAKVVEGDRATITGGVTPVYAAPETFNGDVSRHTDQYSLAIVFQELLTGIRPFNGANTRQLMLAHIQGTPNLSSLPPADQPIIGRGLEKKPTDRWPTCTELVRALRQAGSGPVSPVTPLFPLSSAPHSDPPPSSRPTPTRAASEAGAMKAQTPRPSFEGLATRRSEAPSSGSSTPMPALVAAGPHGLVTPRLVTPGSPGSSSNNNPALTLQRPASVQTGRMGTLGIAPPESTGDGTLFPALVIGLGAIGRSVLQQLKRVIAERYGNAELIPNVRFLYLDTDPEAVAAATAGLDGTADLAAREVLAARLNRPAHYLQATHLPPLDNWMPPGSLYKLSRNPSGSEGIRAFGRLALFDNYRPLVQRLRQEIETFLTDEALTLANKATQLGLRTNRPRTYLVAGLGGGTGGGMFLDLAFLIRHELRQVGYLKPEVVGLFFTAPTEKSASRSSALGNTHAALTELHHFQSKKTRYQVTFDRSEAPVLDTDVPLFARAAILELPKTTDPKAQRAVTGRAARALYHELLTPAGRVVDEVRDVYRNAFPSAAPTCQTFGLFRLSRPRAEVLVAATRRFAQQLLQRWMAKEAGHLREWIEQWLAERWDERKLAYEPMMAVFQGVARETLREDPDKVFDAFIEPLRTRTPSSGRVDAAAACSVLDQLIKVVGKPESENESQPGLLLPALAARYQAVAKEAEKELAAMPVWFLERPQFRLAGAEEAVRQIAERLKRHTETLEPMRAELDKEVRGQYNRLLQLIAGLNAGGLGGIVAWKSSLAADLIDLLKSYSRKRFQLHVLDMALSVYRKLLGVTPDFLREIGSCRATLAELHTTMTKAGNAGGPPVGPGKMILPEGCKDLDQAADHFLATLSPKDLLDFDQILQAQTEKKFRRLIKVCAGSADKIVPFREMLLSLAREFLDTRLDRADPAKIFFQHYQGETAGHPLIGEAFDEADPGVTGRSGRAPDELVILAAPVGPSGDRLRAAAAAVYPEVDFTPAPLADDIVFYREYPRLDMADLPQFGDAAREAYQKLQANDHPAHTRIDVAWQAVDG